MLRPLSALGLFVALGACASAVPPTPPPADPPPDPVASGKPRVDTTLEAVGLSASALDRSVDPCDDFYAFACGGWQKSTPIPDDKSRWVRSFNEIHERNERDLRAILDKAAEQKSEGTELGRLGRYYASCMDEAAVEKSGTKPIQPLLDAVKKLSSARDLTPVLAELHGHGVWAFFDLSAGQDFRDATKMIGMMDQNGLGLPDRDYYLSEEADEKAIREMYLGHVEKMLVYGGYDAKAAKAAAADVMRIETELAKAAKSREERRDPAGMYNKIDRGGLEKAVPSFAWKRYFEGLGSPNLADISVTAPKYFDAVEAVAKREKAPALRNYLTWMVLHHTAPLLSKAIDAEHFELQKRLTGQKVQQERYKRCIAATDGALGELLAQPFVDLRFAGESKAAAETYVREIASAMRGLVDQLEWMDEQTRDKARQKLSSMAYLIGYPAKWKSYDFTIDDSYAANALRAERFEIARGLAKVGKPVDRGEWYMSPPTVNAYYDPQKNQMVFPAGILQPPFYSAKAHVPVNLGAMGMVVGHELTHGFDDEGSQFDHQGNLSMWWSPQVRSTFEGKAGCVDEQYSKYEPLPGVKMNGKLTLGENIADAGGIKLAFRAYRNMRAEAESELVAEGFGEDQQFFLATGQIWCANYRDEYTRLAAQVDPHAHPRFRVNGPLSHLPEFAEAFSCKPGAKMVEAQACTVW